MNLIIGTDAGVFVLRGGRLEHPEPHDVSIRGIVARGDRVTAVGKRRDVLLESDDGGRTFRERPLSGQGWALEQDDRGRLWIGLGPPALVGAGRLPPDESRWSFFDPDPPHVLAIAVRADLVHIGIEMGGIYRSEDGGATWRRVETHIDDDVHRLRWAGDRLYCGAQDGLHVSDDLGLTWRTILPDRYVHGIRVTPHGVFVQAAGGRGVIWHDGVEIGEGLPPPDFGVDGLDVAPDGTLVYGADDAVFVVGAGAVVEGLPKIRRLVIV